MKWKITDRRARPYVVSTIILLVGLVVAIGIYFTADTTSQDIPWELTADSRKYLRALELYGGKLNVFAVEFSNWFDGLWHGKSLAFTVAVLALVISALYLLVALRLASTESDESGGP
jgi:hypothetical protein